MTPEVVSGHIDPVSGVRCGWANGLRDCKVPDCDFPDQRCVCVDAERADLQAELEQLRAERRRLAFPVQNGLDENEHGREWKAGVLDRWIAKFEAELDHENSK